MATSRNKRIVDSKGFSHIMFADLCLQYAINHADQLSYAVVEEAANKLEFILWDNATVADGLDDDENSRIPYEDIRKELGLDDKAE
jgi:hypothetical protein